MLLKWVREWFILSTLLILGMGLIFVLWAIWPLLPNRLPAEVLASLDPEGVLAMGLLIVVTLGFGKLLTSK